MQSNFIGGGTTCYIEECRFHSKFWIKKRQVPFVSRRGGSNFNPNSPNLVDVEDYKTLFNPACSDAPHFEVENVAPPVAQKMSLCSPSVYSRGQDQVFMASSKFYSQTLLLKVAMSCQTLGIMCGV
jgi:hypothetical protein